MVFVLVGLVIAALTHHSTRCDESDDSRYQMTEPDVAITASPAHEGRGRMGTLQFSAHGSRVMTQA